MRSGATRPEKLNALPQSIPFAFGGDVTGILSICEIDQMFVAAKIPLPHMCSSSPLLLLQRPMPSEPRWAIFDSFTGRRRHLGTLLLSIRLCTRLYL